MLPRKYKLKRDKDFQRIFRQGRYFQKDFVKLRFLRNDLKISRFAFVVGLKISKKAVIRNKTRRQMEEIIRLEFSQIKTGFDVVVLVEKEILNKEYQKIERSLIDLLKQAKLWN